MNTRTVEGVHPWLLGDDTAPALITAEEVLTYADLRAAVADRVQALQAGPGGGPDRRRLVLLEMRNDIDSVLTWLAALIGAHPVVLTARGDHTDLIDRFGVDVVARGEVIEHLTGSESDHCGVHPGEAERAAALHPELAALLSTSGSTGSPKLVRLSGENLVSNAEAIATYLGIRSDDVALMTLPLHYCYGLSVLNSHLARGAAVVLTEGSVTDPAIWEVAARAGVTTFPGVPWTYELLDHQLPALPRLRYLTQAGGKMPAAEVGQWREICAQQAVDLIVMYGQTEATARMAWLPPDLAEDHPHTIGVPIPGGSFRLADLNEDGIGELVYSGPNVMLGYATSRADLARGRDLTELPTGDLGRQTEAGLWEITGRRSRFGKIAGLRIDLDRVEAAVPGARVAAPGNRLHVFVQASEGSAPGRDQGTADDVRAHTALAAGLPTSLVTLHRGAVPRRENGKVDQAALDRIALAAEEAPAVAPVASPGHPVNVEQVAALYAELLNCPVTAEDSFISLGGESLTYVVLSSRLAALIGHLPPQWPSMSVTELAQLSGTDASSHRGRAAGSEPLAGLGQRWRGLTRRWHPLDLAAVLRALAIVAVVVSHVDLVRVMGGAHLLLVVAGYNIGRFVVAMPTDRGRTRQMLRGLAAVCVPATVWIAGCALAGRYDWSTAFYLRQWLGSDRWNADWQMWFLEVMVWVVVAWTALLAVAPVARAQRSRPWLFALGVTVGLVALRFAVSGETAGPLQRYEIAATAWFVALGWLIHESRATWQRAVTLLLAAVGTIGFFADPQREAFILVGVALVVAVPSVRLPRTAAVAVTVLANASLWIYLVHWQVYPALEDAGHPWWALAASLAAGGAGAWGYGRVRAALRQVRASGVWPAGQAPAQA